MNKLLRKIAVASVGFAMAIGIGVSIGASKGVSETRAEDIYDKYSGALTEGDYILYYNYTNNEDCVMKAVVASGRLSFDNTISVSNDSISTSDASIVWHIAASGNYWTIYNADTNKYAAGTGVKNKAQLLADGTDDESLWECSSTAQSVTYDFVNKANKAASVNANLRNNQSQQKNVWTNYGFACYAAGTGGALTLFKKRASTPSSDPDFTLDNNSASITYGPTNTTATFTVTPNEYVDSGATYTWSGGTNIVNLATSNGGKTVTVSPDTDHLTATATSCTLTIAVTGCKSKTVTVYVNKASTSAVPFTIAEARATIDSGKNLTNQYVKGVVYEVTGINSGKITYWISDNGSNSVPFEVYKGLNSGGVSFSAATDIKVGDIVVVNGNLTKFNSTYEFTEGSQLVSQIHVASIAVKTAPSDVDYDEGENFDPTGLVVTATYDDTPNPTTKDFAYADLGSAFTFNPSTSAALSSDDDSVDITLFGKTTSQSLNITARTVMSVTVTGTDMTNKTYVKNAAWDLTGLSLTVTYNIGEPAVHALKDLTVGTDFTLSKATADGTTSLTIEGTYEGTSITSRTITGISYVSEITFTAGTDQGTSGGQNADTMKKYGITVSGTSMATTTAQYRIYSGSTLTISSSGENIRKIEFTDAGDSSYPASRIKLKSGESGEYADLTWLGDTNSIAFSPDGGQARVSVIKVTTASGYAEVHIDGLSVNGSAATIGQEFDVSVVKGKTYTLDVAVTPDNTTDSKAITYSVYSGSGASVSPAGVITAGNTPGATAVIKAESAADSTYYVYFNVTVADSKTVYDIDFECTASTTQFNETTWGNATSGSDADYLTYDDSYNNKVYPDADNSIKFGSSSIVGKLKLTTPDSIAIKRVIVRAKSYGGQDTPTIAVNGGTAQEPTDNWSYLVFDLATASDTVSIEGTTGSKGRFYIDDIVFVADDNQAAVGAFGYAAEFMNSLDSECANESVSTSTWSTLNGGWTTMENSYSGSQAYFLGKTPSPRDSEGNTPTGDVIQKALARYDFVVGKYNKVLGIQGINDFMGRDPDPVGAIRFTTLGSNNNSTVAVVIISLVSVTAVGGYFLLRKKKED